MKTMAFSLLSTLALSALVLGPVIVAAEPNKSDAPKTGESTKDAATTCMVDTMHGSQTTEEGSKAMQEFMHSPKRARAMNNMMEMARRMGNGDLLLGMTKMMEMMGGRDGMMGGQATPESHQPK